MLGNEGSLYSARIGPVPVGNIVGVASHIDGQYIINQVLCK